MKAKIELQDGVHFKALSGTGHSVDMDGPEEYGGKQCGARPMELILMGMGGCASFDVVHILRKSRQDPASCICQVDAERAESDPKVFTSVHLHFILSGDQLSDKMVKKAVQLSAEKYCSASIMIAKTAKVSHSYEISE